MSNYLNPTTNAESIPTIIAQKTIGRLPSYLNLARTVARDTDFEPATVGQTIKVNKRGSLTASDKAVNTDVTLQQPTATTATVTLNKHKEVTFGIEDFTKVITKPDLMTGYAEDAAIALAEAIETSLAALHPSITTTVTFDNSSATTMEATFLDARERMALNKVPRNAPKYAYLHPTMITDLLTVDRFTNAQTYGRAGAIAEGALMRIAGFDIFESQLVQTSGSPVRYHNLMYAKNGLVLATRPLPVTSGYGVQQAIVVDPEVQVALRTTASYDHKGLSMLITLDCLYGVAILDDRLVLEVESD